MSLRSRILVAALLSSTAAITLSVGAQGPSEPVRKGVATPGVSRSMSAIEKTVEFKITGSPDWSVVTKDSVWVTTGRADHVVQMVEATNKVGFIVDVARPCSGLADGFGSVWSPSCKDHAVVRIDPAKGSYKGMLTARAYQLQLPGNWPPASVTVNGKALKYSRQEGTIGWRYDGNQLATIVQTERFATSKPVEIRVKVSPELAARRSELAGVAGAMTRLRASYDALNQTWPLGWSPDDLTDAMQSGNRLTYHPELAGDELKHFHDVVLKAQAAVEATSTDVTPEQAKRIARRMGVDPDSDAAKTRFAEIQTYWQRGHALLGEAVSEAAGK